MHGREVFRKRWRMERELIRPFHRQLEWCSAPSRSEWCLAPTSGIKASDSKTCEDVEVRCCFKFIQAIRAGCDDAATSIDQDELSSLINDDGVLFGGARRVMMFQGRRTLQALSTIFSAMSDDFLGNLDT